MGARRLSRQGIGFLQIRSLPKTRPDQIESDLLSGKNADHVRSFHDLITHDDCLITHGILFDYPR